MHIYIDILRYICMYLYLYSILKERIKKRALGLLGTVLGRDLLGSNLGILGLGSIYSRSQEVRL